MSDENFKEETDENVNQLNQEIGEKQGQELSYMMEASQADDKRSKWLAKQSQYLVMFEDEKSPRTLRRKPLSSDKNKEIDDLRTAFAQSRLDRKEKIVVNGKTFANSNDVLFEAFIKTAEYCLGISRKDFGKAIWEDEIEYMEKGIYGLRSVLAGCLLRAVHGVAYFHQP